MNSQHLLEYHSSSLIATEISKRIEAHQELSTSRHRSPGDLTNGIIDYSLKCLNGPHKNKFVYINQTPEGETIGSDEDRATLYIENANLHPLHAQVRYSKGMYFLKDLDSKTGTWHSQVFLDGAQVEIEDGMQVKICDELFIFSFGEQIKEPVRAMFKKFDLEDAYFDLKRLGLDTIEKVQTILYEQMEKISRGDSERRQKIEAAINAVKMELIPGFLDRKLQINYGESFYSFEFRDFIIGNTDPVDLLITPNLMEKGRLFEVIVTYQQGRFWLVTNPARPIRELFIKLKSQPNEINLRADDIIKIGDVEMRVCRFNTGSTESIGTREYMEDRTICIQDINVNRKLDVSLFAVFDG